MVLLAREESHFWDVKSRLSKGGVVQKIAVALANGDGGEFALGIEDAKTSEDDLDRWQGYSTIEDLNPVHQALAKDCLPQIPYSVDYLEIEGQESKGFVCLVTITKSADVHYTAAGKVYVRHHAASTEIHGQEIVNLSLSKGAQSYEDQELGDYFLDEAIEEQELRDFLASVSPAMPPADFLRRERLYNRKTEGMKVSAALLYADKPQSILNKRCGIKIARYETDLEGFNRDYLKGVPQSLEGPARVLIELALDAVSTEIQAVQTLDSSGQLVPTRYPPETLKEIIVNAVIHRDYNLADDILIYIYNNRVEVHSPGKLPGHITLKNIFTDRASRNGTLVRLLNKYPDPPNKDIGEGLQTAFAKMKEAKLKAPEFRFEGNYFVVKIGHTPLARPEELILEYLESHPEITNRVARDITGIQSENLVKQRFYNLQDAGSIERVPGKAGSSSAWRQVQPQVAESPAPGSPARDPQQLAFDLIPTEVVQAASSTETSRRPQRWQPKRETRRKRKTGQ
ncbi:ATP-binding protein [Pseudarthrobacter albicanus]|uniref:ATP-binding protein n=1 Tax=Pseudarthrobacter albicanus TaxID=2823873 RepID=UPI001FE820C4|nr:ATP-binding protein [Pseudarthrobacter albicanus]